MALLKQSLKANINRIMRYKSGQSEQGASKNCYHVCLVTSGRFFTRSHNKSC
jgi:hypothetical protein